MTSLEEFPKDIQNRILNVGKSSTINSDPKTFAGHLVNYIRTEHERGYLFRLCVQFCLFRQEEYTGLCIDRIVDCGFSYIFLERNGSPKSILAHCLQKGWSEHVDKILTNVDEIPPGEFDNDYIWLSIELGKVKLFEISNQYLDPTKIPIAFVRSVKANKEEIAMLLLDRYGKDCFNTMLLLDKYDYEKRTKLSITEELKRVTYISAKSNMNNLFGILTRHYAKYCKDFQLLIYGQNEQLEEEEESILMLTIDNGSREFYNIVSDRLTGKSFLTRDKKGENLFGRLLKQSDWTDECLKAIQLIKKENLELEQLVDIFNLANPSQYRDIWSRSLPLFIEVLGVIGEKCLQLVDGRSIIELVAGNCKETMSYVDNLVFETLMKTMPNYTSNLGIILADLGMIPTPKYGLQIQHLTQMANGTPIYQLSYNELMDISRYLEIPLLNEESTLRPNLIFGQQYSLLLNECCLNLDGSGELTGFSFMPIEKENLFIFHRCDYYLVVDVCELMDWLEGQKPVIFSDLKSPFFNPKGISCPYAWDTYPEEFSTVITVEELKIVSKFPQIKDRVDQLIKRLEFNENRKVITDCINNWKVLSTFYRMGSIMGIDYTEAQVVDGNEVYPLSQNAVKICWDTYNSLPESSQKLFRDWQLLESIDLGTFECRHLAGEKIKNRLLNFFSKVPASLKDEIIKHSKVGLGTDEILQIETGKSLLSTSYLDKIATDFGYKISEDKEAQDDEASESESEDEEVQDDEASESEDKEAPPGRSIIQDDRVLEDEVPEYQTDRRFPQVGARVRRGGDWKWGDQDRHNSQPGEGEVIEYHGGLPGWVRVQWDGGHDNQYRMGAEGAWDLEIIGDSPSGPARVRTVRQEEHRQPQVGERVHRGADWKWDDQDHDNGRPGDGRVIGFCGTGWVRVRWDGGHINRYRMGAEGAWDLEILGDSPTRLARIRTVRQGERRQPQVGDRVRRGADWKWGDQDYHNGRPGEGRVIAYDETPEWFQVEWDNGDINEYRMGAEGAWDLEIIIGMTRRRTRRG